MAYSTIAVKEDFKQELLLLQVLNKKKSMEELLQEIVEEYKKFQSMKKEYQEYKKSKEEK